MAFKNSAKDLYEKTDGGLDIIKDWCPAAAEVAGTKKSFKMRADERTASAVLYPPKGDDDCWHVVDYGMGEGERRFSPIDIYMYVKGYNQSMFSMALHELMEQYGVAERLSTSVNKPLIEKRKATAEELKLSQPLLDMLSGCGGLDLSVWGPCVREEHLQELGWQAVRSITYIKGDDVTVVSATDSYPIFAQKCDYTDSAGVEQMFWKVYQPHNPDKARRFLTIGRKPRDYVFGLNALRKRYAEQGEEKLDVVLLVSGGSDAVNAVSMGYSAVWGNSETELLTEATMHLLLKYARRVVYIPDFDRTGQEVARRLALQHPELYVANFMASDFGNLTDERGRRCKDLKDYVRLHPRKTDFQRLVKRGLQSKFWSEVETKDKGTKYVVSAVNLYYFLSLHGYVILNDGRTEKPHYVRIKDHVVENVTAQDIIGFLQRWMDEQGLDAALQNQLLRSQDLPTAKSGKLLQVSDLDFSASTAALQEFYFEDCWVEVTAEGITRHRYDELAHCVWKSSIIPHRFQSAGEMFSVENMEGKDIIVLNEKNVMKSPFAQFVVNTCRLHWRKEEELHQELSQEESLEENQCFKSRIACMGYLLHDHMVASMAVAPIMQDNYVSESTTDSNGRSGKSLFDRGARQLKSSVRIDGRKKNLLESQFLYEQVNESTRLIAFEDCHKDFNYDAFYEDLTDGITIEKKGVPKYSLPFVESPKLLFSTNFVIKATDPSTIARLWKQPFSDYYHVATRHNDYRETRTVRSDLGMELFDTSYKEDYWQADFTFMMQCLTYYLSLPCNERKVEAPLHNIEKREQLATVGMELYQWLEENLTPESGNLNRAIKAQEFYGLFLAGTGSKFYSQRKFTQRIKEFCMDTSHHILYNPKEITHARKDGERYVLRDSNGTASYYYFKSMTSEDDAPSAPQQTELAF